MYTAPRRLYTTTDGRVTDENDPEALFLLAPEGAILPEETATRYRLRELDSPVEAAAPAEPAETKHIPGPRRKTAK